MPPKKQPPPVQQTAIGEDITQIAGNNNTVNKTIKKIYQFFMGDAQISEQRDRRIMLGHVENFYVKGILEKSLHGVALLELSIKKDMGVLNSPLTMKREGDREELPVGISMLAIFEKIGMGRSLLILGSPGSGKTTMLLELTRQLIERAREDVIEPIPVVFNLSSWTEKYTFGDWLAKELNTNYYVPYKTATSWVNKKKLLLLLDGLDEVRPESQDNCVEAINRFRSDHGLINMAICSRIQDYANLTTRLSFNGAIEIQPLTLKQVNDFFGRFGRRLTGIRQALKEDTVLREMAETPLFLSIMTLVYQNMKSSDIRLSKKLDVQRKQLFDVYIETMFQRSTRMLDTSFTKQETLRYLHWLARMMTKQNISTFQIEMMQPSWLEEDSQRRLYLKLSKLAYALLVAVALGGPVGLSFYGPIVGLIVGAIVLGLFGMAKYAPADGLTGFSSLEEKELSERTITTVDRLSWSWKDGIGGIVNGLITGAIIGIFFGWEIALIGGLVGGLIWGMLSGMNAKKLEDTTYPGQRLRSTLLNGCAIVLLVGVILQLLFRVFNAIFGDLINGPIFGLAIWIAFLLYGLGFGLVNAFDHYLLRFILVRNKLLPSRLIPFLDYCSDLIFLRRVGGGYIFVHRLLMEHFVAMYPENEK